ncbi:M16 family metallopeptidase [Bowmanella pacifica]|uniref:Peptidase M16 n=1 Tax=Bowmanella pacifica TaxID=502051 RepID=A0A918DHG4_9ALTE|nr:pitrilysin family protein [Bowmanella pacifica]GGO66857.1 peptidase M16 [Bowmanella pacifica]
MKKIAIWSLLAAIAVPVLASPVTDNVQTFSLENGMKFLVLEDHSIPNANSYLFWRVGSRNEYPGITGLSHFFEHMMFNGAKKYGPKEFDRTMEAAGGSNNAYTTENLTVYTNWFPAEQLDLIFELEADRIEHLAIDPQMVESERGVVISERSTGLENSNFRAIWEEVKGSAFRAHPYSWSVIGHESDIENWSLQDLVQFHKTYYAPNNAVMVVAGDVTVEEVKKAATKHFAAIPAQTPPREVHTIEPPQKGERRVYLHKASVSSPNLMMAFHVPNSRHEDYYALSVLADILATGNSSRLQSSLVFSQQLASDLFAYFPESIDPNLFYIYAVASPGKSAEQLEKGIIAQLQAIKKDGITEQELQKVKNRRLVDFYREMATINGKANTLGTYEMYFGDYRALFDAPTKLEALNVTDIQRVARQYLKKANRTVGILDAQEDSHEQDL